MYLMLLLMQVVVPNVLKILTGQVTCHRALHNSLYYLLEATVLNYFVISEVMLMKKYRHNV